MRMTYRAATMAPMNVPVTVQSELTFEVTKPALVVVQMAVDGAPSVIGGRIEELSPGQHAIEADEGTLYVHYLSTVTPDRGATQRPGRLERIEALRPSRYCPSDRMLGFAATHFGQHPTALDKVHAICDYVYENTAYEAGTSDAATDAADTLLNARGVCRDFAHLVAALCRAVEVPARVAAVYAPGLSPMDFHLVVEAEIDGVWQVWDATRLAPRPSLVRIATGRDAADVAFSTILFGRAELTAMQILATVAGDLPGDDHRSLVSLP
jgi:transglutaminase-like putative cysteine protease